MKYKQMLKIRKTEKDPDVRDRIMLRHDPQLRIWPSMPMILQICAPKHAAFARLCQRSRSNVSAC